MKRKIICKYLCLLFVAVCSVLFTTVLTAVAVQTDGSMKVIAHIETHSDEDSSPANTNTDSKSPPTGNDSNLDILIPLLFVSGGALIVTAVCEKRKKIQRNKHESV